MGSELVSLVGDPEVDPTCPLPNFGGAAKGPFEELDGVPIFVEEDIGDVGSLQGQRAVPFPRADGAHWMVPAFCPGHRGGAPGKQAPESRGSTSRSCFSR